MTQLSAFSHTRKPSSMVPTLRSVVFLNNADQNQRQRYLSGLFQDLSQTDKAILSQRMHTRSFGKNTIIDNDRTNPTALWIVEKGRVKVTKSRENGKEVILGMYSSGDFFGIEAFANDNLPSEFVITIERSRLSFLKKRDIVPILLRNPDLSLKLVQELARRLRQAYRKIECLALMDVSERVIQLFNDLAETRDNVRVIPQTLTHAEIANFVGASREMVSRVIKLLIDGGYIVIENRTITIKRKL